MQKRNKYLSSFSENAESVKKLLAEMEGTEPTERKMRAILASCAKQLLSARFTDEEMSRCLWLIEELKKYSSDCEETEEYRKNDVDFAYVYKEDLLGALYLSLRELTERKKSGSYYTPKDVSKRLMKRAVADAEKARCLQTLMILDPACGTGSILLELPKECEIEQIYGYDIDPIAIAIVRINMALTYHVCDRELLTEHFAVRDFLQEGSPETKDVILGNPPWGSAFTAEEKDRLSGNFRTAGQKSVESGDLFVEQSLKVLRPGGQLCFVLPEALLQVKTHRIVRSVILEQSNIRRVEYLGEVFEKVQCPSVILTLEKKQPAESRDNRQAGMEKENSDIEIITEKRCFKISAEFSVQNNYAVRKDGIIRLSEERFLLDATEEEFALLQKLAAAEDCVTLKGQAEFALGIVTGNNAKHLLKQWEDGCEPILRGTDIERFYTKKGSVYIRFVPENYQQVAPVQLYRAPEKLLYRFVGERPIFAYDDRQTLTLNSCNVVIPAVKGMDMRYIMAVFNSSVMEFWHRRCNHSMKLLRAHIEGFPIPLADKERQQEIIRLVERLRENEQEMQKYQVQMGDRLSEMVVNELCMTNEDIRIRLDWKIAELFCLTDEEYELVKSCCNAKVNKIQ